MTKVSIEWSLEDLCDMDEQDMDCLLQSFPTEGVPSLTQLRAEQGRLAWSFDGSFGWSCVI
jgi:precorrin-2 dehydrogenase / sirohydrochlorin ferrochelatase